MVNGWKELLKLCNFVTVVEFWSNSKSNQITAGVDATLQLQTA